MTSRYYWILSLLTFCFGITVVCVHAQDIPPAVQSHLDQQGMTADEARQMATQLGIDLTNPRQAAQRARELGIPDTQIRALLLAVQAENAARGNSNLVLPPLDAGTVTAPGYGPLAMLAPEATVPTSIDFGQWRWLLG